MDIVKLDGEVAFCDQPSAKDLWQLNALGIRTLVNVRLPTEQLTDEAELCKRAGLRYVHIPVAQREWSLAMFDQLAAALRVPGATPAVIHSAQGARAGVLALTWHGARVGWDEQAITRYARQLGITLPDEAIGWLLGHRVGVHPAI